MSVNFKQEIDGLSGKVLLANPHSKLNDLFNKSVIYMIAHSKEGAIGLIINHFVNHLPFKSLFKHLEQEKELNDFQLPIYFGGPMDPEKGFVLHSKDYQKDILFEAPQDLVVTSNLQIVKDIAAGSGPRQHMFVMGYTGWQENQLEEELNSNYWIIADSSHDLIFNLNHKDRWQAAINKLGINPNFYSSHLGHS